MAPDPCLVKVSPFSVSQLHLESESSIVSRDPMLSDNLCAVKPPSSEVTVWRQQMAVVRRRVIRWMGACPTPH